MKKYLLKTNKRVFKWECNTLVEAINKWLEVRFSDEFLVGFNCFNMVLSYTKGRK